MGRDVRSDLISESQAVIASEAKQSMGLDDPNQVDPTADSFLKARILVNCGDSAVLDCTNTVSAIQRLAANIS
jgi:hypothetical protein